MPENFARPSSPRAQLLVDVPPMSASDPCTQVRTSSSVRNLYSDSAWPGATASCPLRLTAQR